MKIGCHVSIAGGVEQAPQRASELGCESFQIFTKNQRQWISKKYTSKQVQAFKDNRIEYGFAETPILSHASYLINMSANDPEKLALSRKAFEEELLRCSTLGIEYCVVHPGSHGGNGEEWGIERIIDTIEIVTEQARNNVMILLESTAGQGNSIGHNIEHLHSIISGMRNSETIGICLDTCHIFAAGYSIDTEKGWLEFIARLDKMIGINRLKAIHLNDSLREKASKKDRHAAIGKGKIGKKAFKSIVHLLDIPGILEVPGGYEVFKENIELVKQMRRRN